MRDLLVIRADAGPGIGTGHVMRCLALAQAWRALRGGETVFAGRVEPAELRERIEDAGFSVVRPEGGTAAAEAAWLAGFCRSTAASWLVLDGYGFDPDFQHSLANGGFKVMVVDDYAHLPFYEADAILNQNIGSERFAYHHPPATRLFLGPKNALLRYEFRMMRDVPRTGNTTETAFRVLVSMGGADPTGQTVKALAGLDEVSLPLFVTVVAGPASPCFQEILNAAKYSRHPVNCIRHTGRMAALMHESDICVSAAGSSCWELCCLGVPMLLLTVADNQTPIAQGLDEAGIARSLGWYADVSPEEIACEVESLLNDHEARKVMACRGRKLVDGLGAERVARALLSAEQPEFEGGRHAE